MSSGAALYESQEMLNKYMLMHWGRNEDIFDASLSGVAFPEVKYLPVACADLIRDYAGGHTKALDLGCAVGRSTFEMARDFEQVLGIDFSHEFIEAAQQLREYGTLEYRRKISGSESDVMGACVDKLIDRDRVSFQQGDACALPESLQGFDAVLLANVLCRLPDPQNCLARMRTLLRPGGVLVMTTPLSWLADYTAPSEWIPDIAAIATLLPGFELLHQQEMQFVIREHRRKFEYIVTQASVWCFKN